MPAASVYGVLEGFKEAGLHAVDLAIFEELGDARTPQLTANSTTMYAMMEA